MATIETIEKYFPKATKEQLDQFILLENFIKEWNEKINVISRKNTDSIMEQHILHSLSIVKLIRFKEGTRILDVGCGGGFPGLPLAIFFPDVQFHLVDAIAKKIKVVNGIAEELGLKNVIAEQRNVKEIKEKYDFVISRAVTAFPAFVEMAEHCVDYENSKNGLPNGIIYLKGGDFSEEIASYNKRVAVFDIADNFCEDFFKTKKIIYLQR